MKLEFKMNYDNCKECGLPLKEVKINRSSSKACGWCLGEYASVNKHVRKIFKEMQAKPTTPDENEMLFEDDPRAEKENDYGRVVKQATVASFGVSPLAEIMTKSNHHFFKREPRKGTN
jgi:hypothetical protein